MPDDYAEHRSYDNDSYVEPPKDLTRFVYLVEGEPFVGTVEDFAKAMEQAFYYGLNVSSTVWTFDGLSGNPLPHAAHYRTGDTITVTLSFEPHEPEKATIRLDDV